MSKTNILLVEDDVMNMMLMEESLILKNYNVEPAFSAEESIKFFNEKKIDLVIMDIELPEMNGTEAMKKIKETNNSIPIIALTGMTMKGDREKLLEEGFSDYLSKPYKIDSLIDIIEKHL